MTETQSKILAHLLEGGEVVNSQNELLKFSGVVLEDRSGDGDSVDLVDLVDYEIYVHPLQAEVDRLQAIIKLQNEKFQQLAKREEETSGRKAYVTLDTAEKKELCEYAKENPTENKTSIAKKFGISDSNCARILDEAGVRKTIKRT